MLRGSALIIFAGACSAAPAGSDHSISPAPAPSAVTVVSDASPPSPPPDARVARIDENCSIQGSKLPLDPVDLYVYGCRGIWNAIGGSDATVARSLPVGVDVVASNAEFEHTFGCAPPSNVDFRRGRVAVYRVQHSSHEQYTVSELVQDGDRLVLVFNLKTICMGAAPTIYRSVHAAYVPDAPAAVDIAICRTPPPRCGLLP